MIVALTVCCSDMTQKVQSLVVDTWKLNDEWYEAIIGHLQGKNYELPNNRSSLKKAVVKLPNKVDAVAIIHCME